jgi:hypothetical protein
MTERRVVPVAARRRVLAVLMTMPVVLMAAGVTTVEVARWRHPNSTLFAAPVADSFADAIGSHELAEVYQFVRTEQDPSAPIAVRHPALTGGRTILVSPLLWAVALQRGQVVLMFLGFGARTDGPAEQLSACLADSMGNADLAILLRRYAAFVPAEQCPPLTAGSPPLLALLEAAEVPH